MTRSGNDNTLDEDWSQTQLKYYLKIIRFYHHNEIWGRQCRLIKASISGKKTETNIFDLVLSIDKTIFTLIVSDTHWLNYYII